MKVIEAFFNVFRDNITTDILQGCAVVTLTLLAFIGLVWLREQIVHGGGPEWLDMDFDAPNNANNNANPVQQPQLQPLVGRDGIFGRQQPIPLPNEVDVNPEIDNLTFNFTKTESTFE